MRATLLPYSGGKKPMYARYILPYLQVLYENGYRNMRSPFIGGGYAELGWVLDFEDTTLDASDLNGDVVSFYQTLLDPKQSKKFYSDLERVPITATTTLRWIKETVTNPSVRFYLVQKLAFQSFASSNGRISSVKYEQYKRMMKDKVLRDLIKEIQQRHKDISIRQENVFVRSSFPKEKKTFLFLDPPYYYDQNTKNERYGLQHYYYEGHKEFDHAKLAKIVKKAKVPFLLFYNDDPTIRKLYDDCEIVPYTFRGKDEILITNISINK
jgi:site-specific DNA-adenine methylase